VRNEVRRDFYWPQLIGGAPVCSQEEISFSRMEAGIAESSVSSLTTAEAGVNTSSKSKLLMPLMRLHLCR
jgi:hypothetical protein